MGHAQSNPRPQPRSAWVSTAWPLLLCAVLAYAPFGSAATTVYRSVDAEGRVVYSDQPPKPGETKEAVEVRDPTSFEAPPARQTDSGATAWDWDMQAGDDPEEKPFVYTGVSIIAPANDEGVRENAGNVTIVAGVEPSLRPGDRLEILLDGTVAAEATGTTISLTEVDRGTHTLVVQVVDASGTVVVSSEPSTFHMLRYAPLMAPNRPVPAPHGN